MRDLTGRGALALRLEERESSLRIVKLLPFGEFDLRRSNDLEHFEHQRTSDEPEELIPRRPTEVRVVEAHSILSYNNSPDIGFEQSINPYQGCEHGCVYCYARPTHAYLGMSPGLDFETRIQAKTNAAELLRKELARASYRPSLIALGANTDPYQPAERDLRITRSVLAVLSDFNAPVSITTKSALVARDIDILAPMAKKGLARVNISLATVDPILARILDPRANAPHRRLRAIQDLSAAGVDERDAARLARAGLDGDLARDRPRAQGQPAGVEGRIDQAGGGVERGVDVAPAAAPPAGAAAEAAAAVLVVFEAVGGDAGAVRRQHAARAGQ